jgi:predicted nucleotidyltransferase
MLKGFTQAIKDKLESEPRLHAVLIYGSQANSSASPSSDIDIAYLADYKNHANHLVDFEDFYRVILSWVEGLKA